MGTEDIHVSCAIISLTLTSMETYQDIKENKNTNIIVSNKLSHLLKYFKNLTSQRLSSAMAVKGQTKHQRDKK